MGVYSSDLIAFSSLKKAYQLKGVFLTIGGMIHAMLDRENKSYHSDSFWFVKEDIYLQRRSIEADPKSIAFDDTYEFQKFNGKGLILRINPFSSMFLFTFHGSFLKPEKNNV